MEHIDPIKEAQRYLLNAKETLSKSPIEYGRYKDSKYVSEAAGIAYLAGLKAIDGYLLEKGIPRKQLPKSIEGYWVAIKKNIPINGKLYAALNNTYEDLHIGAYYRGFTDVDVVKAGLQNVQKIIDMMSILLSKKNGDTPVHQVNESSVPYKKSAIRKKKVTVQSYISKD